jgi:N-acetylated-alpha-linked acidic dipeptidase
MLCRIRPSARGSFVLAACLAVSACHSTGSGAAVDHVEPAAPARPSLAELQAALLADVDPASLARLHEALASRPHPAGSPGDAATIEWLAAYFTELGLEVEVQPFWALLSFPEHAELELISPERLRLPLMEDALAEDPDSSNPELDPGWNAYAASADVRGEVVYANYGTAEDFARLAELGIDCRGKIVLARYGGNYRGYKVVHAEAAGAIGLILFTDPEDAGWGQGLSWPEGGYANGSSIQRGSVLTLPYYGDPTTPGRPATEDAERLDVAAIGLPTIPVQPIGWDAAQSILQHMAGPEAPQEWQGGLPMRYRLTGGAHVEVRLAVQQTRRIARTANVVATLRGSESPEQSVVIGSHHDAWTFGAADPCAGLICVLESARVWARARDRGVLPRRSIAFACWGAEEYGIIGSVEWIESRLEDLGEHGVAYVNLDMAAMGLDVNASASPSLQRVLADAAAAVDQPGTAGASVLEAWRTRAPGPHGDGLPAFGDLGGGSDHAGFVVHAGLPSVALSAGGARGVSYHTAYDDLTWYRSVVGEDYGSAALVTELTLAATAALADDAVVPLDPSRFGREAVRHLATLTQRGRALGLFPEHSGAGPVDAALAPLAERLLVHGERLERLLARAHERRDRLDDAQRRALNDVLVRFERAWLDEDGLPGRPWFKSLFAAADETSGYAAWMLPALRHAIERSDRAALDQQLVRYDAVLDRLEARTAQLEKILR